jgi:phosphatidate cytidylyltransferase
LVVATGASATYRDGYEESGMLRFRLISGTLLGVGAVWIVCFAPPIAGVVLVVVLACLGLREFFGMLSAAGVAGAPRTAMAVGTLLVGATYGGLARVGVFAHKGLAWQQAVLVGGLLAAFVSQFRHVKGKGALHAAGGTILGILYVPYLLSFLVLLAFEWNADPSTRGIGATGMRLILYLVLVVKITDVGAYTFGRLFGRHKMVPVLSPKKTWEGAVGGVVAALLASAIFIMVTGGNFGELQFSVVDGVVLGVLLAVTGQVGDLCESLLKRVCAVKDSGNSIPGMGGVLDVLDSLLFGAPVLYLYLKLDLI